MAEATLAQILSVLDATCFPPSASTGVKTNLINKVRNMFYNSPEGQVWKGTDGTLALAVVTQPDAIKTITLPRGWQTILGVYDDAGNVQIFNGWYSFSDRPVGACSDYGLMDLGWGFCGVANIPATGAKLAIQTTVAEAGSLTIVFYGTDVNGNPISEIVAVPSVSGNIATTTATFYSVSQVVKSVTAGAIVASIVGSPNVLFARYLPGERSPDYRRYQYTGSTDDTQVTAKCKRHYTDLVADNDPCDICNILALEMGLRAYRYYQAPDIVHAKGCFSEAFDFLNGELARDEPESSLGYVSMEYESSGGSVVNLL